LQGVIPTNPSLAFKLIKNVLYAMSQRDNDIPKEVKSKFLELSSDLTLLRWIKYLKKRQKRWEKLEGLSQFLQKEKEQEESKNTWTQLPLRFQAYLIETIYQRIQMIQRILVDPLKGRNCWGVLSEVSGIIFKKYSTVGSLVEVGAEWKKYGEISQDDIRVENIKVESLLTEKVIDRGEGQSLDDIEQGLKRQLQARWQEDKDSILREFLPFYRGVCSRWELPQTDQLIQELMDLIPELRWYFALEQFLPLALNRRAGELIIEGSISGKRLIKKVAVDQILDSEWKIKRQNERGRHDVAFVKFARHNIGLVFKAYPELPGVEYYTTELTRRLIGYAPKSDLFNINGHPVLVMEYVDGSDFTSEVLETHELDQDQLADRLIMEMLLNPEDGKPDNYRLQ